MKKSLNTIKNIAVWLVTAVAVCMMIFTVVSVLTLNQRDRNLLGYRAFIVLSDSMSATDFDAGDVVLVRETDPETLDAGDIIAFISQDPDFFGETITHKICRRATDAAGEPGFVTYGTTTDVDDATIVTYPYILGKYQFRLPKVGTFFQFLKTTPGYILCILMPFLLLILMQGWDCVQLFRQYKAEQMAEITEERRRLEKERKRSEDMMKELLELKAQLGGVVLAGAEAGEGKEAEPASDAVGKNIGDEEVHER